MGRDRGGYRFIALTASISVLMQFLDSTALNTAIPAIAQGLGVPAIDLNIALLAYQLAMILFIPLANVVSARVGPRNVFILSLAVFAIGAIFSALSVSLAMLVAARTLQGIAGAIMIPVARTLVIRAAAKNELISAMNWLLIPAIIGPLMGPALGGMLVTYASWHAIFLINVPIALLGIVMALMAVSGGRDEVVDRFDRRGSLLIAPALVGLLLGLGGVGSTQSPLVTAGLLAMSLIFGLAYLRHARRAAAPIVDLGYFAVPSFRHSVVCGLLVRVTVGAGAFLLPLWFQLVMGISAVQTGMVLMMPSAGVLCGRVAGGFLIHRFHPRTLAIWGVVALSLSFFAIALLQPDWPLPVFYLLMAAQGVGLSIALMVINPAAFIELPPERVAPANATYLLVHQLSMALGIILGVGTLNMLRWLTEARPTDGWAYAGSMVVLGVIAAGAALFTRRFDRDTTGALRPDRVPQSA